MKDYSKFKAPFISTAEVRRRADEFREKYAKGQIPVDIEAIVEFDLHIFIVPKSDLCRVARVDAALSPNCRAIHVDLERYNSKRYNKRVRFSIAHEVGHLVLHRDLAPDMRVETPEEWKHMVLTIPQDQYGWCEMQAYEFAGRLLVPVDQLAARYKEKEVDIAKLYEGGYASNELLERFSESIIEDFDVSADVISKRLQKERIWPFPVEPDPLL